MRTFLRFRTVSLVAGFVVLTASFAHAQANRTWVSGVGDDVNPCSRTAPCKTFAGAISKTAAGGFIDVLDPGGFGTVTITKSITIDGSGGSIAGIITTGGIKGIIINSATAIVHLRNLSIESPLPGNPSGQGLTGIDVIAAAQVHVEHCVIASFSASAINFHPVSGSLFVNDTTVMNNTSSGIVISTGRAMIDNVRANGNGTAFSVIGNAIMTVRNSFASGNATGFAATTNAAAVINIENSLATHNTTGVSAANCATARLSNTVVVSSGTNGLLNDGVSNLVSMQGNSLLGNPVSNAFTQTVIKQ